MYPPVSYFNECAAQCETALTDMEGEHGEFDVHVSPARVDYKARHKGAVEADAKAKQVSVEQNDPSLYAPVDPALIETRCMGTSSKPLYGLLLRVALTHRLSSSIIARPAGANASSHVSSPSTVMGVSGPTQLRKSSMFHP